MDEIKRLKTIRRERGISNELMARDIGVSLLTLTRWLSGQATPSLLGYRAIREYLDREKARSREVGK